MIIHILSLLFQSIVSSSNNKFTFSLATKPWLGILDYKFDKKLVFFVTNLFLIIEQSCLLANRFIRPLHPLCINISYWPVGIVITIYLCVNYRIPCLVDVNKCNQFHLQIDQINLNRK